MSNREKNVLLVSYVFPPMAAVGGHRVISFCKYLPQNGWNPVVLTVKNGVNAAWDSKLNNKVSHVKTYRTKSFIPFLKSKVNKVSEGKKESAAEDSDVQEQLFENLSRLRKIKRYIRLMLTVPDPLIFWIPFAVLKGFRVIRKEKISVILSSSPPVSVHIIASILGRLTGTPYVTDFRDLWTLNHVYNENKYPSSIIKYDSAWERFVLSKTANVITASPGFSEQMKNHFENRLAGKVETITNGFDYDEIDQNIKAKLDDNGILKFVYTGSLYSFFNPVFFLECLSGWISKYKIDKNRIRVDFYGESDTDYTGLVNSLGLETVVKFHGFKSQSEIFEKLISADYLLLFLGFNKSCKNVIPAKLFEYLASGTKVLAFAPPGVTDGIIKEYDAGYCLVEADSEKTINTLNDIYDRWNKNEDNSKQIRYIEQIDRKEQVKKLAGLLDNLTDK